MENLSDEFSIEYDLYLRRYLHGEWRAPIFRDLIVADAKRMQQNERLVLLDIGCGCGFDNNAKLQDSLAKLAHQYVGVEPDIGIRLRDIFTTEYRCRFEDASIPSASVDIAFAVMVLEHFPEPQAFWDKIYDILRPDGVFWGFTVDARHWFVTASLLAKRLHIKDWYLNKLHGSCGEERYENYDVYYRSNSPKRVKFMAKSFSNLSFLSFQKVGQLDYYLPFGLRWLGRSLDKISIIRKWPGSVLAIRAKK